MYPQETIIERLQHLVDGAEFLNDADRASIMDKMRMSQEHAKNWDNADHRSVVHQLGQGAIEIITARLIEAGWPIDRAESTRLRNIKFNRSVFDAVVVHNLLQAPVVKPVQESREHMIANLNWLGYPIALGR